MLPASKQRRGSSSSSKKRLGSVRSSHSKPTWNANTSLQEASYASSSNAPKKAALEAPIGLSKIRQKMLKR